MTASMTRPMTLAELIQATVLDHPEGVLGAAELLHMHPNSVYAMISPVPIKNSTAKADQAAWRRAMGCLKRESPHGVWHMWFSRLGLAFVEGDQVVVMAENRLIRDWIRGRHILLLRRAMEEAWGRPMRVVLVTYGDDPAAYGLNPGAGEIEPGEDGAEDMQQTA